MNMGRRAGIYSALVIFILLATAGVSFAQKGRSVVRRVSFPRGRTTTILRGAVKRGLSHDYLLRAQAGQTMTVHLASESRAVTFTIRTPDGDYPADFARDWQGQLPVSGDYRINVLPPTETEAPASYTLEVTIR
jgi:hypothetical protein